MYFSAKEILAQLEGTDKRICDLVIQNETELFETPYDKIMEMLEERYQIMYNSAHDALEKEIRSLSGLTGGSARKMWDYYKKGSMICDGTIIRGAAYALSCLEVNASMGLIVAAPHRRRLRHPAGLPAHRRGKARHPAPAGAGSPGHRFGHRPADCQKGDRLRRRGRLPGRVRQRRCDGCGRCG